MLQSASDEPIFAIYSLCAMQIGLANATTRILHCGGCHRKCPKQKMVGGMMSQEKVLFISDPAALAAVSTRRDFLRLMGIGGAIVLLPSVLTNCASGSSIGGLNGEGTGAAGSGSTVTIDFSKSDVAVLQFAYALEQLEADFYTKVAANFSASGLSSAEQTIFADIKNHEVIHREALKTVLGPTNGFSLTPVYAGVNFSNRDSILAASKAFEDLGVAAYNGAAQYLTNVNNLLVAGKIVSVEARHASAIADIISPKTTMFAPSAFDDAFSPAKVRNAAQAYIVEKVAFANPPAAFVQGPNNNG